MEQKKSNRMEKVNSLIQQLLSRALLEFFKEGPAIVTISRVVCSKDLRWAKAFVTIANGENKDASIMASLRKHAYEIQGMLNTELEMKMIPRVSFYLDTGARYAAEMNAIFKQIEDERKENGVENDGDK